MKNLFKPEVFKGLIFWLIFLLLLKLVWFVVELLWLPSVDIDQERVYSSKNLYYRVKLTPNRAPAPKKKNIKSQKVILSTSSIMDLSLLAIYNASDMTVVTVAYKNKTKVLAQGDEIKGFVLESAGPNFAIFSKSAKTYKLLLIKNKKNTKSIGTIVLAKSPIVDTITKAISKPEGEVTDAGDHKVVDRSLIEHYTKNVKDIYKDIGISEVKKGKGIDGFKITFVRKDSPFSKLGIRREDIIKSINGQEINSYNAALNIYRNIESMENLTLVIKRGKEEMELDYEIN